MRTDDSSFPMVADSALTATTGAASWAALTELLLLCSTALRDELSARSQSVDLSGPQFALLWACESGNGGLSQRELALRLSLSTAHVSGLVEQLGLRGLIVGERAANDRRRQFWRLTDQGRDAVRRVLADLEPFGRRLNSQLSAGTREQLEIILRQLTTALQREPGGHELSSTCAASTLGGAA